MPFTIGSLMGSSLLKQEVARTEFNWTDFMFEDQC